MSLRNYLKGIANVLRERLNTTEPINAQDFPSKIEEVYIKAYDEGGVNGVKHGIELGKQSMVDESKIIEKIVTGQGIVSVNDVSEVPHDISVKLTSNTVDDISTVKLYKQGKNLVDIPDFTFSSSAVHKNLDVNLFKGKTVTLSALLDATEAETQTFNLRLDYIINGATTHNSTNAVSAGNKVIVKVTVKIPENAEQVQLIKQVGSSSKIGSAKVTEIMFELGSPTEYEPYIEPTVYDVLADGTVEGVKSISPKMTLFADADVEIKMTYHKSFGMQAEYDAFWDEFQQNGNRRDYSCAFAYSGWTDEIYNPKYPIKPATCNQLFNGAVYITNTKVDIDLTDLGGNQKYYLFSSARKLKTVKKLIVYEGWIPSGVFDNCVALENIVIEGTLGRSINMQWSTKLTVESALSIINSLKDYTGTDKFGTYTLTFADEVWVRLETVTPPDGYTSWRSYTESKGWLT